MSLLRHIHRLDLILYKRNIQTYNDYSHFSILKGKCYKFIAYMVKSDFLMISIFEDFAFYMMEQARKKRVTDIFKLKGNVYVFDRGYND